MVPAMEAVVVRRKGEMKRRVMILAATVMAVAACAVVVSSYKSNEAAAPNVESMYHMWLGPNGLPLSPRKQRGLLFQFCTTNFVSFIISLLLSYPLLLLLLLPCHRVVATCREENILATWTSIT